ncbi:hypothetical protein DFJ58DRAFT_760510 [Suillus subalutaceus]|uniref:uncharacterized protein n=1 Tax=Suillus subalutaceus TaxID=48586 RepID=UPI001B886467|nr:uncharacterized protein DFJ58DRAFT_760510 [Suillus subalutaceus]KAG1872955.1 hypothetical protein DFJ58DRAFT_760510 [Suillus subalutaceus]
MDPGLGLCYLLPTVFPICCVHAQLSLSVLKPGNGSQPTPYGRQTVQDMYRAGVNTGARASVGGQDINWHFPDEDERKNGTDTGLLE